jgi:hypothetical protein
MLSLRLWRDPCADPEDPWDDPDDPDFDPCDDFFDGDLTSSVELGGLVSSSAGVEGAVEVDTC